MTALISRGSFGFFAPPASVQGGGNAAITGTVTDPTGAVIPGATVTATQAGTGFKRSATAEASGGSLRRGRTGGIANAMHRDFRVRALAQRIAFRSQHAFGTVGKGAFRGPTVWNMDLGIPKRFYPLSSHENLNIQLRGEFFNVFNNTELNDAARSNTVTRSSGNFGTIRAAYDPRIIQLALKVFF